MVEMKSELSELGRTSLEVRGLVPEPELGLASTGFFPLC